MNATRLFPFGMFSDVRPDDRTGADNAYRVPRRQTSRFAGFTLLEVIVAVGLMTIVVTVISTSVRLYFVNLRHAQTNMELTELARNTLQLIASDVRAAIQYKPVDVSGLQELIDSQAAALSAPTGNNSSGESGDEGEEGDGNGNGEGDGEGDENNGDESNGESSASNEQDSESAEEQPANAEPPPAPPNRPKFIGGEQELYVDVSRLPRIDQYHPILHMNERGSYTSLPTDVKSVSYFVSFEGDDTSSVPGGLYRREVDRATVGSGTDPDLFSIDAATRQVALEVVAVTFRYFDGESWQGQWDSDELGGYPMAVEITIVIDPARSNSARGARYQPDASNPETLRTFRTVTKLPLAELLTAEEQELIANPTEFSSPTEASGEEGDR